MKMRHAHPFALFLMSLFECSPHVLMHRYARIELEQASALDEPDSVRRKSNKLLAWKQKAGCELKRL